LRVSIGFIFSLLTSTFIGASAHALLETRVTYTGLLASPSFSDLYSGNGNLPDKTAHHGLGIDALISLNETQWNLGLRYENLGMKTTSSQVEFKANHTRTAFLVNYRHLDAEKILGVVGTVGVSHSGVIKCNENEVAISEFSSNKTSSYSIGVEAGIRFIDFIIGVEVGYLNYPWPGAGDAISNDLKRDIDMSGNYGKLILGFGI